MVTNVPETLCIRNGTSREKGQLKQLEESTLLTRKRARFKIVADQDQHYFEGPDKKKKIFTSFSYMFFFECDRERKVL